MSDNLTFRDPIRKIVLYQSDSGETAGFECGWRMRPSG